MDEQIYYSIYELMPSENGDEERFIVCRERR